MQTSRFRASLKCIAWNKKFRTLSTRPGVEEIEDYSKTLFLPKTKFPLWSTPEQRELQFRERTTTELYKWQWKNAKGPLFVLHDGPPYANGHLHTGHALNKILKDIIIRFQILQGRRVNYVPGWDCHGLPVENKALAELQAEPNTLPATTVREAARKSAEAAVELQMSEMQEFGLVADWSREGTYRTLDHAYEMRQLRIFQGMVQKNLVYRQFRPIYWSPSSQTALAEAELKYEEGHTSRAAFVKFIVDKASVSKQLLEVVGHRYVALLVWTTTPWTLPANMAIAVNVELKYSFITTETEPDTLIVVASDRLGSLPGVLEQVQVLTEVTGQDLLGITYLTLVAPEDEKSSCPVIAAGHVTGDTGTGLVHIAPAHGAEDYLTFTGLKLHEQRPILSLVDNQGRFTEDVGLTWGKYAAELLIGKEVLYAGNREVLAILQTARSLVSTEKYKHKYPYDWRTGKPVVVRATSQWFADLSGIRDAALSALEGVSFHPPSSRTRLESFIKERSEWCISRQRTWGVPIPALYLESNDEAILTTDSLSHILTVLDAKGTSYWWEGPVEEFLSPALQAQYPGATFRKGTDTMDVWFDSGTSWSLVPANFEERTMEEAPVVDVCLEGSDQHRGWFQSLLLTRIGNSTSKTPAAPYKTVITHGFLLDGKGKKMSKSLGNVVSPMTIIKGGTNSKLEPAYGADVLRLWAASSEYGVDITLSRIVLDQATESLRKLRNTARFILGNLRDECRPTEMDMSKLSLIDRYVLHELWELEKQTLESYKSFAFHRVVAALNHFTNVTMSSFYFDINKDCLYADGITNVRRQAVLSVLQRVLSTLLPIMAPIVPHLAEEVYHTGAFSLTDASFMSAFTAGWAHADPLWEAQDVKHQMEELLTVRRVAFQLMEEARKQKKLGSSVESEVLLVIPGSCLDTELSRLLHQHKELLPQLFIVSDVLLLNDMEPVSETRWAYSQLMDVPGNDVFLRVCVRPSSREKCPRCWTFSREDDSVCSRCRVAVAQ